MAQGPTTLGTNKGRERPRSVLLVVLGVTFVCEVAVPGAGPDARACSCAAAWPPDTPSADGASGPGRGGAASIRPGNSAMAAFIGLFAAAASSSGGIARAGGADEARSGGCLSLQSPRVSSADMLAARAASRRTEREGLISSPLLSSLSSSASSAALTGLQSVTSALQLSVWRTANNRCRLQMMRSV